MKRAPVAVLLCLVTTTVQAQSLPSKKEATALVQKAMETTKLKVEGVPFHLVAKIHYEAYSRTSDGSYELLWSAPDRFREEFRLDTAQLM
jgi:outer membrane lipoprotein-sorting protein